VRLDDQARVLVVSGANAGGKTVALKTVGLITLMVMCGLHAPCREHSRVSVFTQVLAEVGDEQDLDRELSTFTAHAGRLAWMVKKAARGSLLLIDEIGGGTDPGEGAALAVAVLDWLKHHGARVLCTTHFHRLKAYAATTDGVANVSVAFDTASGRPTYQLHYGLPGFSDALAVSRSLGFPPELVTAAQGQVDQGEAQTLALMRQVQEALTAARADRAAASSDRLNAAAEKQEARALLQAARREQAGALAEGKRRVREVAARLERRLEELLTRTQAAQGAAQEAGQPPKPGRVKQELYAERRQALAEVEAVVLPRPEAGAPAAASLAAPGQPAGALAGLYALKAGDGVMLTALEQRGTLLEDPRPGLETIPVSVGVGGVRVVVPLRDMEPLAAGEHAARPARGVSVLASAGDGMDLNVVGLTVDDALPLVDKALDQAILAGKPSFSVVHGVGTGRLRAAVRDYLNNHPYVVATRRAEGRRGGAGVTVAELRE
jgi:DNA mismatch repair protein MutS2